MNAITITTSPEQFIFAHEAELKTNSLKIAEAFEKRHSDVLRTIEKVLTQVSDSFRERNFALSSYEQPIPNGVSKKVPMYELTKDGFIMVVMSFTGAKAMAIKEAYINAFNLMAEKLFLKPHSTPEPKTKKALPGCLTLETQDEIKQLIKNQAALLPKDKQAGFIIAMWSALGTHFGIKKQQGDKTPAYKYIPEGARLECLSLIARLSVDDLVTLPRAEFEAIKALPSPAKEGELLPKEALPDADALIRQLRDDGYLVARANRQGLSKLLRDYIPRSLFNELIEVVNERLKSTDHEQIIIRKEMLAQITRTLTCMGVIYDGVLVRIEQAEQETGLTLYNR